MIWCFIILLVGFLRNLYFNFQVQNIRNQEPYYKQEKIWHILNLAQIFMIVGYFYLENTHKILGVFVLYWVVVTFIMGKTQKGWLYFGDGKGDIGEEIMKKISELIKLNYEKTALIARLLLLVAGSILLISCGKIDDKSQFCYIGVGEVQQCISDAKISNPGQEEHYYEAFCHGEIKVHKQINEQCEAVFQ